MRCRICGKTRQSGFVCLLCEQFRQGLSWDDFKRYAKKVTEHQQNKDSVAGECLTSLKKVHSRRAAMIKRDKTQRACKGNVVSAVQLADFLDQNRCFYCGDCASGIDRIDRLDCYPSIITPKTRASCQQCNVMRRDFKSSLFISHLERVSST